MKNCGNRTHYTSVKSSTKIFSRDYKFYGTSNSSNPSEIKFLWGHFGIIFYTPISETPFGVGMTKFMCLGNLVVHVGLLFLVHKDEDIDYEIAELFI